MKIIAQAGSRGPFIVEASEGELLNIAGFDYGSEKGAPTIETGKTLPVHALWKANGESRRRKGAIAKLATELRAQADVLDKVNSALAAPIVEVEVKT